MTPTERTLQECRRRGWIAGVAEKWIAIPKHPGGGIRKDLFGFIDVVAITNLHILGIQATSGSNVSSRRHKILEECTEEALAWLDVGGRIAIYGWTHYKKPIDRKRWRPRIVEIGKSDFESD